MSDRLPLVIVAGAAGFLDSPIVRELLERGYHLRGLLEIKDLAHMRALPQPPGGLFARGRTPDATRARTIRR